MTTDTDPQQGGSYVRDPDTGALTPAPVPETDQAAAGDQAKE